MSYLYNGSPATLSGGVLSVGGVVVAIGVAIPYPGLVWEDSPQVQVGIVQAKAAKLAALNSAFESALLAHKNGYPPGEIVSWDQQLLEAQAYRSNPSTAVPLLSAIAANRPGLGATQAERIEELAERIVEHAAEWAESIGELIGERQALEDEVDAIVAEVDAGEKTEEQGVAAIASLVIAL